MYITYLDQVQFTSRSKIHKKQNGNIVNINNLIDSFVDENYFPNFFQTSSSEMFNEEPTRKITEEIRLSPTSHMEKLKQKFMNTLAQLEINTIGIYQVE